MWPYYTIIMPISCNHLLVYYNPEGQVLILEFWGDGNGKRWKDEILTDSKGESSG